MRVSDLHQGHCLVSELRGFASLEQHDEVILSNLREIPDGALLVCLGDISVRRDDETLRRLRKLKREKSLRMILVPGNYDRVHPMCGMDSVVDWTPKYREVFDVISLDLQARIGRWLVLLTHIPRAVGEFAVVDPHQTDKLVRWAAREGFECTVQGHTHSDVAIRRKNVNVSLEATGLCPVSPEALEEMVTKAVQGVVFIGVEVCSDSSRRISSAIRSPTPHLHHVFTFRWK